jgi:hypothetical protein
MIYPHSQTNGLVEGTCRWSVGGGQQMDPISAAEKIWRGERPSVTRMIRDVIKRHTAFFKFPKLWVVLREKVLLVVASRNENFALLGDADLVGSAVAFCNCACRGPADWAPSLYPLKGSPDLSDYCLATLFAFHLQGNPTKQSNQPTKQQI